MKLIKIISLILVFLYFIATTLFIGNFLFKNYKNNIINDTAISVQNQITKSLIDLSKKCDPLVVKDENGGEFVFIIKDCNPLNNDENNTEGL